MKELCWTSISSEIEMRARLPLMTQGWFIHFNPI